MYFRLTEITEYLWHKYKPTLIQVNGKKSDSNYIYDDDDDTSFRQ